MARNLDEPGANFNQLLELSLKLQNARTFAGTVADASTEMEQYPDTYLRPGETLEDWTGHYFRKPNAAGGRIYGEYAQQIADGGRAGYKDGRTVGNIVDVRNVPYYAAEGLEGLVHSAETLSKFPLAAGELASKLIRQKPNKKMFTDALANITPGSWSEKIKLKSLIEDMAEKKSPEAKAVGNVLGLGTEVAVPTGGAFKAGQILLSKASKAMGKVKDGKTLNKLIDEKLTDSGQSRRDFNIMVSTSGLMVALKSIGLGGILKTASKTANDFTVKLRTRLFNSDVDYGDSGEAFFDISALTPKVKKVLHGLMKNRSATKPGLKGKDYFNIDPGDAKSVIKELKKSGFKGKITGIVDHGVDVLDDAVKRGKEHPGVKEWADTFKKQSMKQNIKEHSKRNYVVYENDPGWAKHMDEVINASSKSTKAADKVIHKPWTSTIDEVVDLLEPVVKKAEGGRIYGEYAQQLASGGRAGVLRDGLFDGGPPGVHGRETGGGYSDRERHERRQPVKGPPGGGDPGMTYKTPPTKYITKKKYPPSLSSPTLREEVRKKREEAAFEAMWRGAPPSMGEREKMFRKYRTAKLLEEKRISDFAKKITEREKLYPYTDMTEEEFSEKYSKVYDFMKKDPNWNWEEFQKVSFANPGETFQATGARDIGLPLGATDTRDIDLFMTPFGKTNLEMTTAGPKYGYKKIMSDQDKAQVALHEMRHKKILTEPILKAAQPPLAVEVSDMKGAMGVGPQKGKSPLMYRHLAPPGSKKEFSSPLDMHEVFTRFMDRQYGHLTTPSGPYFDKIWRDEWQPYADKYENILTEYDLSPVNLAGGGRVPLNKGTTPYNAETFKEKSDLYLQAILGTSDKDFYRSKLQNEYEKAMKEGALSAKEAMEWVQKRAKLYSTLIDESKRQERTLSQELRGIGSFSLPTPYGVEPDINKYYGDKKAMGGRVGLAEGDTPSQAWMRNNFFESGYDDKGVITLDDYINGGQGWRDYMEYGPGKS